MNTKRKTRFKIVFFAILFVSTLFALADSLGFFNPKEYTEVNHGAHNHYVPHDRDPNVPLSRFPMDEPEEDERITPTGQVVKKLADPQETTP